MFLLFVFFNVIWTEIQIAIIFTDVVIVIWTAITGITQAGVARGTYLKQRMQGPLKAKETCRAKTYFSFS